MLTYSLKNLKDAVTAIGRAVVMRADYWDGTKNLTMTHLGDTEGEFKIDFNESFVHRTMPELTGNAKHETYVEGEDPVLTFSIFTANPELRELLSPTGNASGGYSRRRKTKKHTLALFPEELLYDEETDSYKNITFDGDAWKVNDKPLTAEQERLLSQSVWLWRGYFSKPPMSFKHQDAGKSLDQVTFQVMLDANKPEGEMLYTLGDPAEKEIDIHPES